MWALWYRMAAMEDVRIDKWLWAARLFKSRTLAATACSGGKVDVNGQAAKASRALRPGDLLEITRSSGRRIVRVAALSVRRGPGSAAALLYEDLTPPPAPGEARPGRPAYRPPGAGRPTKRDRRLTDRLIRW
jgi:ribosome-associated heat shock protein Hsp15